MQPDPVDHLPLINHVIKQMGLKGDIAEEAFSESLVIITKASQTYDPNQNVPVANWLAIKIRWSLKRWLWKQRQVTDHLPLYEALIENSNNQIDNSIELKETIAKAQSLLTPEEYFCIIADAFGYQGRELARRLNISEVQVSRIKKRARIKLAKLNGDEQ